MPEQQTSVFAVSNFSVIKAELEIILEKARAVNAETGRIRPPSTMQSPLGSIPGAQMPVSPLSGGKSETFKSLPVPATVRSEAALANTAAAAFSGKTQGAPAAAAKAANTDPFGAWVMEQPLPASGQQVVERMKTVPRSIGMQPPVTVPIAGGDRSGQSVKKTISTANKVAEGNLLGAAMSKLGPAAGMALAANVAVHLGERGTGAIVDALRVSRETGQDVMTVIGQELLGSANRASEAFYSTLLGVAKPAQGLVSNVAQLMDFALTRDPREQARHAKEAEAVTEAAALWADNVSRWAGHREDRQTDIARGRRALNDRMSVALAIAERQQKELNEATLAQLEGFGFRGSTSELQEAIASANRNVHATDFDKIAHMNDKDRKRAELGQFNPDQGDEG